jgi:16S rRNA (cytosine967-C5)-methyltransferase
MARLVALEILRARHRVSLRAVDRAAREHGLDARDRALVRRIVGTEVRRRGTLRVLTRTFAHGKPSPGVQDCIALGLIQLLFLDTIPDHAAVSETVQAAAEIFGPKKAQYVNACLRAAIRARRTGLSGDPRRDLPLRNVHFDVPVFSDPAQHPLLWAEEALSMPVPLVKRWTKRYGEARALELAQNALVEPELSLRVVRGSRADVERAFEGRVAFRPGEHEAILIAPMAAAGTILADDSFANGTITVQGESALRAAELVGAQANESVLDLCAAPGGKTAVLSATGARVTACDDDEKRMARLRQTVQRLVPDAAIETRVHDAAAGLEPASFDAVLVDVPCSNTGVLAARPGARWRFSPESQQALGELQTRLVTAAAECVKPGGRLVYSTCSIEPEENQRRVKTFLAAHTEFALESEIESLPAANGGRGPVDGGYAARMVRTR